MSRRKIHSEVYRHNATAYRRNRRWFRALLLIAGVKVSVLVAAVAAAVFVAVSAGAFSRLALAAYTGATLLVVGILLVPLRLELERDAIRIRIGLRDR